MLFRSRPDVRHVCLFALPINRIDVTGVETFARLRSMVQMTGGVLHVSGIKLPVEQVLRRSGALDPGPGLQLYRTDAEALVALHSLHRNSAS